MNTANKVKTVITAVALAAVCMSTSAQPRHHRHRHVVKTVVVKPVATTVVSNRFNASDRWMMAVAYLKSNATINAKQYAKLTGLTKAAARAELEAFAADRHKQLTAVVKGRKTVYTL